MLRYPLSTKQYIAALDRALQDDRRWPWLCSHEWLIEHALIQDGLVTIDIETHDAPVPPVDCF